MKIPLTPLGLRELLLAVLVLGALTVAAGFWFWPLALVPFAVLCFVVSFFRDPERALPAGDGVLVAPADGTVSDIKEVPGHELMGEPCLRIGIFLSVFNVHVNRAPISGTIRQVKYTPGKFLDARHPRATGENEANDVLVVGDYPVVVRQIAGLIARRIMFPFAVGDKLNRGQRMGMIKFGSRTELYIPLSRKPESLVEVGDKVAGTSTAIARVE